MSFYAQRRELIIFVGWTQWKRQKFTHWRKISHCPRSQEKFFWRYLPWCFGVAAIKNHIPLDSCVVWCCRVRKYKAWIYVVFMIGQRVLFTILTAKKKEEKEHHFVAFLWHYFHDNGTTAYLLLLVGVLTPFPLHNTLSFLLHRGAVRNRNCWRFWSALYAARSVGSCARDRAGRSSREGGKSSARWSDHCGEQGVVMLGGEGAVTAL